jgi:hypothetical protein
VRRLTKPARATPLNSVATTRPVISYTTSVDSSNSCEKTQAGVAADLTRLRHSSGGGVLIVSVGTGSCTNARRILYVS